MINPTSPCFNCIDRQLACHSKCDKYNNFKVNIDKVNKARGSSYNKSYNVVYTKNKND